METKTCKNCGKEFTANRNDAKFCSSSCRSFFWQKNKEKAITGDSFRKQLKGVINDNSDSVELITETIMNPDYTCLVKMLKSKKNEVSFLQQQKNMLLKKIDSLRNPGDGLITLASAGAGGIYGHYKSQKTPDKRFSTVFNNSLLWALGGLAVEVFTKDKRESDRKSEINKANVLLNEINAKLLSAKTEIRELETTISNTQRLITVEKKTTLPLPQADKILIKNQSVTEPADTIINVNKQITRNDKPAATDNPAGKIISSNQLAEMNYQALNFKGRWLQFFGLPSVTFYLVIHGMSGEGKSTFAIMFACYLAENFGPTIYISGEEGFSKTMKDKIINNNAESENLFVADLRSYQDIVNEVRPNTYNFIIIDSLDNMRIGPNEMKELRKLFQNSALISISQSTKDGKMRGSYEIVHDSDIAVSVSNGVATTTKNRFLEKGRTYEIFKTHPGNSILPNNTIKG